MTIQYLLDKIEEIRKEHPNVNEMEFGPVFWDSDKNGNSKNVIMMVEEITIEKEGGWDGQDAIGIHWHC